MFSRPGKKVRAEGTFENDSNFASWQRAVRFVAANEDVNSDQCQCSIFILERKVLNISCGMNDMKAARPSKRARLTEKCPLCSWHANFHILFNTFTLSRTHVLCDDYCQVH